MNEDNLKKALPDKAFPKYEYKNKWEFVPDDHCCPHCEEFIDETMMRDEGMVTGCPFCDRSFVE